MYEHTPGPWTYHICRDTSTARIEAKGGCEVVGSTVGYNSEECEANAKLIAAAPDLLKEYEQLLAYLKDASNACLEGHSDVAEDLCHEYAEFKSPAIAKAKGE